MVFVWPCRVRHLLGTLMDHLARLLRKLIIALAFAIGGLILLAATLVVGALFSSGALGGELRMETITDQQS